MNDGPVTRRQPRVLIIDEDPAFHDEFRRILGAQSGDAKNSGVGDQSLDVTAVIPAKPVTFRMDSASHVQQALKLMQEAARQNDSYALAFLDVRISPGWDGLAILEQIWKSSPDLHAIICTAHSDFSWDDLANRFGDKDNLLVLKRPCEPIEVLQAAHAMARKWELAVQARLRMLDLDRMVCERTQELQLEIDERIKVEEALRISEERFSKAFLASPLPMAIKSLPEGRYVVANSSFLQLANRSASEMIGHTDEDLNLWEDKSSPTKAAARVQGRVRNHPLLLRRADGDVRNTLLWTEPVTLGSNPSLLVILQDVTERLKLEAQLRQSQKLELVGRLTASVAHEFNNLLTVIQGHASLLRDNPSNAKFAAEAAERIVQASQRAGAFTGQLLAFSRKQPVLNLKTINLSDTVQNMRKMLVQMFGERHDLHLDCAPALPSTQLNDGAIEQILVNLAVNARDAMPDGGVIRVSTSLEILEEPLVNRHPDARPGRFVCLTVLDSGCGMNTEILTRIFDPFFTTKEVGKGTGLGLPTVLGIVQQHGGWIEVSSKPAHGSTFQAFFPVLDAAKAHKPDDAPPEAPSSQRGNGQTVLVVEDDPGVLELACKSLVSGGYRVIEASDGRSALEIWERNPTSISILVADVVMPNGLSGGALAKTLREKNPALHVICVSGYNPEFIKKDLPSFHDIIFLPKPYDSQTLLDAVNSSVNKNGRIQNGNGLHQQMAATPSK
jgi:two-component system, cell cycle sensor histidine kinase and response regulator CckA